MAKSRKYANSLVRAFERSATPAYLIDRDKEGAKQSSTWANKSCLAWLGCTIEELSSAKLSFSSAPQENAQPVD